MNAVSAADRVRPFGFPPPAGPERFRSPASPAADTAREPDEAARRLSRGPSDVETEGEAGVSHTYAPDKAVLRLLKTSVKQFATILQTTGDIAAAKAISGLRVDTYA